MSESAAILYLSSHFPDKSEDYIRQMYRQCNNNVMETFSAIQNNAKLETNIFKRIFVRIISTICCLKTTSSSTLIAEENVENSTETNIRQDFAEPQSGRSENRNAILQERVNSVRPRELRRDQTVVELFREYEGSTRRSQEAERRQEREIAPPVHNIFNKPFQRQINVPEAEDRRVQLDIIDETDANSTFPQSASHYREEAQKYLKIRDQFYHKASLEFNNTVLAKHYFEQAAKFTKLYEQANNFAAAALLVENEEKNRRKNTLDLHNFFVKEAIQALDIFLDEHIYQLQNQNSESQSLTVITGRGKHSPNGIPKIKPAVEERLMQRGIRYAHLNPGCLRVQIFTNSRLSNDLTYERMRY